MQQQAALSARSTLRPAPPAPPRTGRLSCRARRALTVSAGPDSPPGDVGDQKKERVFVTRGSRASGAADASAPPAPPSRPPPADVPADAPVAAPTAAPRVYGSRGDGGARPPSGGPSLAPRPGAESAAAAPAAGPRVYGSRGEGGARSSSGGPSPAPSAGPAAGGPPPFRPPYTPGGRPPYVPGSSRPLGGGPRLPRRDMGPPPPAMNELIKAPMLRVQGRDKEVLGVMTREEALALAEEEGVDLVLISPEADPPVARVVDYAKFKFDAAIRAKETAKKMASSRQEQKELKMRYNIDTHDYEVRLRAAQRFLQGGDRVKVLCQFKGREMEFKALAFALFERFIADIKEEGSVESKPNIEGRSMIMILGPIKEDKVVKPKAPKPKPAEAELAAEAAAPAPAAAAE